MSETPSGQVQLEQRTWSLDRWLSHLESIHSKNIDMGLERVRLVLERLNVDFSDKTVITVAGTNGKGTTCALIEHTALALGKSVGVYSSPHLIDYRERVRINGRMMDATAHCQAFLAIEQARKDISLTYFEFGTLAGLHLLANAKIEVVLLEVGLGGRLDAINVIDPNVAIITGIALDHQDWLGDTREAIAIEKAGIMRPSIPAVIGDPEPPQSLINSVKNLQADAAFQGIDFRFERESEVTWRWRDGHNEFLGLPEPQIPNQNASTAIAAMLKAGWSINSEVLSVGLQKASLPGRFQLINQDPLVVLDVAHNPQATAHLVKKIQNSQFQKLHLVVAMLADKDIENSLAPFKPLQSKWYVASLSVPRGAKSSTLVSHLPGGVVYDQYPRVNEAYIQAKQNAAKGDMIVVFGSFFTVAAVLQGED